MPGSKFRVRQGLLVRDVSWEPLGGVVVVRITVRSPERGDLHRIAFWFDDLVDALIEVDRIDAWRREERPLTFVRSADDDGALIDDLAAFDEAWGEPLV